MVLRDFDYIDFLGAFGCPRHRAGDHQVAPRTAGAAVRPSSTSTSSPSSNPMIMGAVIIMAIITITIMIGAELCLVRRTRPGAGRTPSCCSDRRGRAPRSFARRRAAVRCQMAMIGVAVALVVWLALVPLCVPLWQSFLTPQMVGGAGAIHAGILGTAYLSSDNARLFANSLQFAVGAGALLARGRHRVRLDNERTNTPFKTLFFALAIIPRLSAFSSRCRGRLGSPRSGSSISACRSCSTPTWCS